MAQATPPAREPVQGVQSDVDAAAASGHGTNLQSPQATAAPGFQAVNARAASQNGLTDMASAGTSVVPSSRSDAVAPDMDASHGTRSRNRTRINYAEDQEMDFEYSSAATTKKAGQTTADGKRVADLAKLVATDSAASSANKESTPGSSGAPVTTSKKRKAAGAVTQHSQTPPITASTTQSTARKSGTSFATAAPSTIARETNVMTFTKHKACLNKNGELISDDGQKLSVNDCVYLVSEPPGEPYYLCRIMEFLHVESDNPNSPVDSLRVNWFYRPRDVQRFNSDTRLVYGTMHSDMCPLTSLRGKCTIKHRSEIDDMEAYRKERESFYFVQVFDRFIRRQYECIPVNQIINVPDNVKKALDERWRFVVVEIGRVKELTSAVKTCKRCSRYCASTDSVDCAICKNSYHMNCVQPPLPKKPSRGFAWACGPCSRASERKFELQNTPTKSGDVTEAEEELVEEEEIPGASNDNTRAPSPTEDDIVIDNHPATQAEIALAKMWPMRYLGIHCRVEDALQYDDRAIYPRASSRLGPRHQANVNVWHGRPVELVKPADVKKRYTKGTGKTKDGKLTKETVAALEADREERAKRPKWVQDEPAGYVPRGEDHSNNDSQCTAKLIFKMPPQGEHSERGMDDKPSPLGKEALIDDYVKRAKHLARAIGVPPFGVNFLDKAMELLTANNYDSSAALKQLQKIDRVKDLHEPVLSKTELAKFEEGVAKYGSEHRLIRLHMKTALPNSDIVRFYYLWKKTPKGREIWGNYGGRKGSKKKLENDAGARIQAEVAADADDSAFDNEKAAKRHRGFQCKFCNTTHSRQWRRAPGVSAGQTAPADKTSSKDKKERLLLALCLRCAGLWRKYAIQWEDVDEVSKKVAQGGGRALKRRIDEELLREIIAANEVAALAAQEPQAAMPSIETGEPPKKKSKTEMSGPIEAPKKKEKPPPPPKEPTPPPPPIIPEQPTWRQLPCQVCRDISGTIECAHCKLTVHRRCFGLFTTEGLRSDGSTYWVCEQCQNDRNPQVSTDYSCCLCLKEDTYIDLVNPPRVSHKKKTEREREKERLEKELADNMRNDYKTKQLGLNRPQDPREPLKKTTGNNWVHIHCAVFTPEIRFSNAKALEVAEGFQNISPLRHEAVCKLCKNRDPAGRSKENAGACVSCFQCQANYHASCAYDAGHLFGFDITPVKSSRKDQVTTVTMGAESGSATAVVSCKEHTIKPLIHPMEEVADPETGQTCLQVYVENYKQADLTLTGTVRKANLAQLTKDKGPHTMPSSLSGGRRESTANSIAAAVKRGARTSSVAEAKDEGDDTATEIVDVSETQPERRCVKCKIDVTPRWHAVTKDRPPPKEPTPPKSPRNRPVSATLGEHADVERQSSSRPTDTGPSNTYIAERLDAAFASLPPNGHATEDGRNGHPLTNGHVTSGENGSASVSQSAMPPNGDVRAIQSEASNRGTDDSHQTRAPPRHQSAVAAQSLLPADDEARDLDVAEDYLCHKCFIKKKINPTPSPPPRPARTTFSPPKTYPLQLDWPRQPGPPSHSGYDGPPRMPWDDPMRQSQPPPPIPPPVNGMGSSSTYPTAQPPSRPGYPPYGSQLNGYHAPPHHDGYHAPPAAGSYHAPPPPPSRPSMHERHPSFGYPGQPPPPSSLQLGHPPTYPSHPAPRPSPAMNYPPTSQPIQNGMPSPHVGGPPPLQSPPYASAPTHPPYPSTIRTESPFTTHSLPPIAQPLHSSPQAQYGRPEQVNGGGHPSQQQSNQTPHPPPAQLQRQSSSGPQQYVSPRVGPAQPEGLQSQPGRPTTPSAGQPTNGVQPSVSGASASPSLRNLLH